MTMTFGVPPEAPKIRTLVEERLAIARSEAGAKVTVEWRGEQKHLDVISMPVQMLYLNPDTHRIRAQRTLDPERNRLLEDSPWTAAGQDYLQDLLRRRPSNPDQIDPDYTALCGELEDFGQKEPGIITPDGILVDGNTRCAALRELGRQDIRVAVLPADTSRSDINAVELALQLRRDKRRDYSYVNRLIAIEEQLAAGRREEDVARAFNIRPSTLTQDRWVYQLILDAIERSRTEQGAALRLVDFEEHQEKLREIHRDFVKLAATDPDGAQQLRETRLAMVVMKYSKTTMRYAGPDFHERFLAERLPKELRTAPQVSASVAIPGLPGVVVQDGSASVKTIRALTDKILQARATEQAGDKVSPAEVTAAASLMKAAKETFDAAANLAGKDYSLRKRQVAVSDRISDAADHINQCAAEFAEARAKRVLDEEAFEDALVTLRSSLVRLVRQAGRAFDEPGEGVSWLLHATEDRG